jgi:hypothetical protein
MDKCCGTCRWWRYEMMMNGQREGYCRAMPLIPFSMQKFVNPKLIPRTLPLDIEGTDCPTYEPKT